LKYSSRLLLACGGDVTAWKQRVTVLKQIVQPANAAGPADWKGLQSNRIWLPRALSPCPVLFGQGPGPCPALYRPVQDGVRSRTGPLSCPVKDRAPVSGASDATKDRCRSPLLRRPPSGTRARSAKCKYPGPVCQNRLERIESAIGTSGVICEQKDIVMCPSRGERSNDGESQLLATRATARLLRYSR
jgi:hypothetical protein